jgi:hypothetical protein
MLVQVISKAEARRTRQGRFRPARAEIVVKEDGISTTIHLRKRGDEWVDKGGKIYKI